MDYTITQLLEALIDQGGSDLHITSGSPPRFRINGNLWPINTEPLTKEETSSLCYSIMNEEYRKKLQANCEIDFSFSMQDIGRFRANVFLQRNTVAGVFRSVPFEIKSIDDLGLPPILKDLAALPRGLVLVTGATGSGKSTTLAAIVDHINTHRHDHILTIEDPIEFLHLSKSCIVNQREVNLDTESFINAIRSSLRQDIDIVLVGELRDLESTRQAVTIAETGHLVLATLHTNSAVTSLNRLIDIFPPDQQATIRVQLSLNLSGVLSQVLVPTKDKEIGRALAMEIMIPNTAIRNLIRENKIHQIYSSMQTGQKESGMRTMNQALFDLWQGNMISTEMALSATSDQLELHGMMQKKA